MEYLLVYYGEKNIMAQLETHDTLQDISIPQHTSMTLEEFLETDVEGYEYVKGELIPMAAASIRHGAITIKIIRYLDLHVHQNRLGHLYTAETSFQIGDRVLKPDVAFVSTERISGDKDKGFAIPPDLAIEVVSPTDIHSQVTDKALAYLDAGTRCVWIVDPVSKTVTEYKSETDIKILTQNDTLTGDDVVPGFSCSVELLFE